VALNALHKNFYDEIIASGCLSELISKNHRIHRAPGGPCRRRQRLATRIQVRALPCDCIILIAGGPGDRWLGHRKMAGREESPDTVLRHALQIVRSGTLDRATRLVTPGACWRAQAKACATRSATESATENRPPAERSTVASRRETCGRLRNARIVWQGEKVG